MPFAVWRYLHCFIVHSTPIPTQSREPHLVSGSSLPQAEPARPLNFLHPVTLRLAGCLVEPVDFDGTPGEFRQSLSRSKDEEYAKAAQT